MISLRTISRLLVVTAVISGGNMCAAINFADAHSRLHHNKYAIGFSMAADKICDKNEHGTKAFFGTVGHSLDNTSNKNYTSEDFAKHLAINYGIRQATDLLQN